MFDLAFFWSMTLFIYFVAITEDGGVPLPPLNLRTLSFGYDAARLSRNAAFFIKGATVGLGLAATS